MADIYDNILSIRRRMAQAAERAGRDPRGIQLVAVTKTVGVAQIREAIQAGVDTLGENRIQEAEAKIAEIGRSAKWHLIGHLQTNKVNPALAIFDLIHSLDSLRLAQALNQRTAGRKIACLLEVNLGGEEAKYGVAPHEVCDTLRQLDKLENLEIQGLMVIPPYPENPEASRPYFRRLAQLAEAGNNLGLENINLRHLSMGMSHDFEAAIEEGATMVRIGTAIFGARR